MGRTIWINSLGLWGIRPITSLSPLPVRPHYGEPTPSNIAELAMGRNFQIRLVQKKTSIFLWVFSVSPLSTRVIPYFFLLFSCALVQEGTCTTWEAPLKGSVPRQIATCERYTKLHYDNCGHIVSLIVIMNGFEDYILSLSF